MDDITNDIQRMNTNQNKYSRELLIENVRNWVVLDQQLHNIHEKTKELRELKTKATANICDYMKSNNITTNIGISNGELRVYDKKEYKPLTFTYVEKCLNEIIKDKNQIEYIMKYLKENRELNITQDIKRISAKL
jgi:spore germination protein YaaH